MLFVPILQGQQRTGATVLKPEDYQHYVDLFRMQERDATGTVYPGEGGNDEDPWTWMKRDIPWFDSSDKQFEEMYYFRWYAWKKHLVKAPTGYIITEWLPKPELTDGSFGALPDAAPFHLGEARWLREAKIAEDDARYWFSPGVDSHKYSDAMATAVRDVTLANGDTSLATALLPALIANYKQWETEQQDSNGLFWSIDTRDAMEKSISGDGYRPTLNSYMYADARAIAEIAADRRRRQKPPNSTTRPTRSRIDRDQTLESQRSVLRGRLARRRLRHSQAEKVHRPRHSHAVLRRARTHRLHSVDVRHPRAQPCDRMEAALRSSGLRWQIRRHHRRAAQPALPLRELRPVHMERPVMALRDDPDPHWRSQLMRMRPAPSLMNAADYYKLFERYVLSQHQTSAKRSRHRLDRRRLDADTDEWIAKDMLIAKNKQVGRGNYYNHSGFADPLITGLIGLRPRADNRLVVHPLLPAGTWSYFAIDAPAVPRPHAHHHLGRDRQALRTRHAA